MENLKTRVLESKVCPFISHCQDYKEIRLGVIKKAICEDDQKQNYEACVTYHKLLIQSN